MGTFLLISFLILVVTSHTPEEWKKIFDEVDE